MDSISQYLPLVGNDPTDVRVDTDYHKGRGYVLCVSPVKRASEGERVCLSKIQFIRLEPAARASAKRLETLAQEVKAQLEAREGRAWEAVTKLLTAEGLTLA